MVRKKGLLLADIIACRANGMTVQQTADHFGVCYQTIYYRMKRHERNCAAEIPANIASPYAVSVLTGAATEREITLGELVRRILDTAAMGGPSGCSMIDAILDDRD